MYHCVPVLFEVDVAQREFSIVVDVDEENLRSIEESFIEASLAYLIDLRDVRAADELLELGQLQGGWSREGGEVL